MKREKELRFWDSYCSSSFLYLIGILYHNFEKISREKSQLVKHLLHIHEVLGSWPQHPGKSLPVVTRMYPVHWRWFSSVDELQPLRWILSQSIKWLVSEECNWTLICGFHMHVYRQTHVCILICSHEHWHKPTHIKSRDLTLHTHCCDSRQWGNASSMMEEVGGCFSLVSVII